MLDWLAEMVALPGRFWSDVRSANKSTGGVKRGNIIGMLICLTIAAGCWWLLEWPVMAISFVIVALIALFWTSEHFEMLKKIIPYALIAGTVGPTVGGIAMYFGGPFQQVTMMVSIGTFIALSMLYGL